MTFINEFVPEEDIKKYNLAEIDKNYFKGHYKPDWTRDSERDIYLRQVVGGNPENNYRQTYTFYWKDTLFEVYLESTGGGKRGEDGWTEWSLIGEIHTPWWEQNQEIRTATQRVLNENKIEIIGNLKEALTINRGSGVYSSYSKHITTFNF